MESPTYYHSLSLVLKSLKEFDMENFPLQKEIVYTKASAKLPEYLREATFNTSIVFHENPPDDDSEEIYSSDSSESIDDDDRDEQQASSEENLGHRMQVKNFLKVFKNSRKTSLEKSQRRALVHALKNRIGIIQGEIKVTLATQ